MIVVAIWFLIALVFAILFWVWVARVIISKINKKPFGKKNTIALILFGLFGWIFFFIGISVFTLNLRNGGLERVVEKSASVASITMESARKGWSNGLLDKLNSLTFDIDSVKEVDDELYLSNSNIKTYEAILIVNNDNANITYKELRDASIVYAEDDNGVFVPAFVVNHSTFDEVPWLFRFLLPEYRRNEQNKYLPVGRSYLNIRIDIVEGHMLKSIGIGEQVLEVNSEKILKSNNEKNGKQ